MPDRLTLQQVRKAADDARHQYTGSINTVPVAIDHIIEIKLGIFIDPIKEFQNEHNVDACISCDLKTICIDHDIYVNDIRENRRRYTLAHELGHYVLHGDKIRELSFPTTDDWMEYRQNMNEEGLEWFEKQAYEFAGRFLVPRERLAEEIDKRRAKIGGFIDNKSLVITSLAHDICSVFEVSAEVLCKRIRKEYLIPGSVTEEPDDDDIPF